MQRILRWTRAWYRTGWLMAVIAGLACAPRMYRVQVIARPITEWSVDYPVTAIARVPEGWLTLAETVGWVALWSSSVKAQADFWQMFRRGIRILFGPIPLRTWPVRPAWTVQIPEASIGSGWAVFPEGLVVVDRENTRLWRISLDRHELAQLTIPEGHIERYGNRLWWWQTTSDTRRFCAVGWTGVDRNCWTVVHRRSPETLWTWTWSPPWWCGVAPDPHRESDVRIQCIRAVRVPAGHARAVEVRTWTTSRPQGTPPTARCWFVQQVLVCTIGDTLHVWNVEARRPRWRLRVGAGTDTSPVLVPTRRPLLVMATRGLLIYGLDLRTGNRRWVTPLPAPVRDLHVIPAGSDPPETLAVVLMDAPPVILNVRTGAVAWRASGWRALSVAATSDGVVMWGTDAREIRLMQMQVQVQLRSGSISVGSQR